MNIFEKRFAKQLTLEAEAPLPITAEPEEAGDEAAFADTLDGETDPGAFDVAEPAAAAAAQASELQRQERGGQLGKIKEWVGSIEEFVDYLNGLGDNSMQAQLNSALCDTLFNDVSRAETKKIARIAQDLSGLKEALKGYILSAEDGAGESQRDA